MNNLIKNHYISSIVTKILLVLMGVFSSVFINRYLGPTLKGEYSYILNIINIFVLLLNLGVYQSYPYYKRKYGDSVKNKYFTIVMYQFLLYTVISLIISAIVLDLKYTIILTLTPLMILKNQLNFISLVENINQRNLLNLGNQLLYVFMLLIIYLFAPRNLTYIFVVLYLKDIVIILRLSKRYDYKFLYKSIDFRLVLEVIKYGIFPMLSSLLITLNYNIDIILLELFVDYEQIGYYSVGVTLANQVWLIPDAFKDVLFSKTAKNDAIDDIKLSIKVNLYISIIIIILITFFGKVIINILYGSEYLPSYSVTVVIFAGLIPMIFYKMIISLFNAKGKQKLSFLILLSSVLLNVIVNFMIIPLFGILGAAFASVSSYTLCGILYTYIFMKEFNVKLSQLMKFSNNEIEMFKRVFSRNW